MTRKEITAKYAGFDKQLKALESNFERNKKKIELKIAALQKQCKHPRAYKALQMCAHMGIPCTHCPDCDASYNYQG